MSVGLELLLIVGLVVHVLMGNYWMNAYAKSDSAKLEPLKSGKPHTHSSRQGYPGKPRMYIIYGGSGFIGSWFARYLQLRSETVIIIDKIKPPKDVMKDKVFFYNLPIENSEMMDTQLRDIIDMHWRDNAEIVVYNCCCARLYSQVRHHAEYDPGLRATEVLVMSLRKMPFVSFKLINIGDTMCERVPIHWMRWWSRWYWKQETPRDDGPRTNFINITQEEVATIYGWYQGAIESLVLDSHHKSAGLRSEGLVIGHVGDHSLAATIFKGYGFLHSSNIPLEFVHVEDLVRAGLALEYRLLDPETSEEFNGRIFSISGAETTTLEHVYNYIKSKRPSFFVVRIHPIVAWMCGVIMSVVASVYTTESYLANTNVLSGPVTSLTLARFYTVQAAHLRNHHNVKRSSELLRYHPNFTHMGPILDEIISEIDGHERAKALDSEPTSRP